MRRVRDVPEHLAWRRSPIAIANRQRLESYRNRYAGQRCFVLANGPSLAKINVAALANEFTISMNRAYLLYEQWGFVPSAYVCVNELVIEQFAADIAGLRTAKFVNFNRRDCFDTHDEQMSFLRFGLHLNDYFERDATKVLASGGTVTFACLQLAFFMGFADVILVGLDHSFAETGTPNRTVVRQTERDESHCHPDYFPKGVKWQLPDLHRSEIAYALAREAFERDGRRILDATIDGKCQVFPKVRFDSLLHEHG